MSPQPLKKPGQPREGDTAPPTVLVVEDEVLIRLMITEYLREFGYPVREARNADEARRILGAEDDVAIVFSDVRMPGAMDGLALARWILRNKPDIAVLLTSAYVAPGELANGACSVSEFLPKPYAPSEVLQRIRALAVGRA
jgi:CheY-like chemotaxis protein